MLRWLPPLPDRPMRLPLHLLPLIFAVACFGSDVKDVDDFGDDGSDGSSDGADGGGDGADGGGGPWQGGQSAGGELVVDFADGSNIGVWTIDGVTADCSGCRFALDADFYGSLSDFTRRVEAGADGYVYTDSGEYWGYGGVTGNGSAAWTTYDAGDYAYAGTFSY